MSIELRHVSFDDQLIESVAALDDQEDYDSPHDWPDWADEDTWELGPEEDYWWVPELDEDDACDVSTAENIRLINELCERIERRIASHLAQ